ncbi:MAG: hypothetical protein A2231_06850 [Candidatus Firestonebacteria bacterium RIFOXYA2_FULL_40_8]|nr:MAG: hypothetical protein A2231_06850 [Candidatus Firestonebacteria bacterium RIFOXYA2_FULL_40_8]
MIRLGIIGTGSMANTHATNFKNIKDVEIVACCDIDMQKVEQYSKKHCVKGCYSDVSEMLDNEKLDAVSVVTSDRFHHPVVMKALSKNLNVMSEKPLALNSKDAWEMAKMAKKKGVINNVNFSYRNSCAAQMAAKLIKKGEIGVIKHIEAYYQQSWLVSGAWGDWRTGLQWGWRLATKMGSNGVLGDVGVHIYDLTTFIAGTEIVELNSLLKNFKKTPGSLMGNKFDANDTVMTMAKFKNGAVGSIFASRFITGHPNNLKVGVYGDKGAIEVYLNDVRATYEELHICRGDNALKKNSWETLIAPETPNMYQRFINGVKSGKNDQGDFATGAKVQDYIDASFKSDKKKGWVKI